MRKRRITEYGGIILICICFLFAYLQMWWTSILLCLVWYFLFGFVGLAYKTSTMRILSLSNALLMITFPYSLVPFRKAFYYWTKAVNTVLCNPDNPEATKRAFDLAKKVNPDNLYTDNNKAMFFGFFSALHMDMGNRETAREYLDKATALPHKTQMDEMLVKLHAALSE